MPTPKDRVDPHSYFDPAQPRVRHVELILRVDFDRLVLEGTATLHLKSDEGGDLDLDTRDLEIQSIEDVAGRPVHFALADDEPILGRKLRLTLPEETPLVRIHYRTSPQASALQWLAPELTTSGRHPFLLSQCQAIHARSIAPLQDSPRARVTYRAEIRIPAALSAVMSAGLEEVRAEATNAATAATGTEERTFVFVLPQPIPPYLLALAVGEIESRDLSPRSRVWAEPALIEAAAWEFADIERMIECAESLFGPYVWERYDFICLPPSFPYGGMENPRMTFLTPTLVAGDRSLVSVLAHELAHSWTGNLVTNATADHFWLNEGCTVWAERRILEALDGPDAAALEWASGLQLMQAAFTRFGSDSALTRLRCDLRGIDPDDVFSVVPYEKGARLLVLMERAVGRERFDAFMRSYMRKFEFRSITTEEFLEYLEEQLPGLAEQVDAKQWLYEVGLPETAPEFPSPRLEGLLQLSKRVANGETPASAEMSSLNATELLVFLEHLPRPLPVETMRWLDETLELSKKGNAEITTQWLTLAAAANYGPAFARLGAFVRTAGRMKYLRPIYTAMGVSPETRLLARALAAETASRQHPITRRMVEGVVAKY